MHSGFWPAAGPLPKWPKLWSAMPIPLAIGSKTCDRKGRPVWLSSRPVVPPALNAAQQAELKAAVQAAPEVAGIHLANWNWKVVRLFIHKHCGRELCGSSCQNYLHRLGSVLKRPKKRLLKANAEKRDAFVAACTGLCVEAAATGAKIFLVDEAHFRADVELRAKWVLRGEPALANSTSRKLGEKATYYSGVCLETGEVESMLVTLIRMRRSGTGLVRK